MSNEYKEWVCVTCGHEVWAQEQPTVDSWSDGHVCTYRVVSEDAAGEVDKEEVFGYLDALRESGAINMFGAAPYVASEFGLGKKEARDLTVEWMNNFGKS